MVKKVEYKAKGYSGQKVYLPARYAEKAKGLIKEVLKLKEGGDVPLLADKHDYMLNPEIFRSVKELFEYNTGYGAHGEPISKQKLRELKDKVYFAVCSYGVGRINTKKTKKVRKKSEEEIRKIDRENRKIQERIEKILRDD
jgi:hypothetical protein